MGRDLREPVLLDVLAAREDGLRVVAAGLAGFRGQRESWSEVRFLLLSDGKGGERQGR